MAYLHPTQNAEWLDAGDPLPESAREQIPASLQDAIAGGNRALFAEIENSFPMTFAALAEAPPVRLLHLVVERMSLMGGGGEDHLYYWVVEMDSKALEIYIPDTDPDNERRRKYQAKHLDRLPAEFACFYRRMDGLGVTPDYGMPGRDFPRRISNWVPIMDFARDQGLDPVAAQDNAEAQSIVDGQVCMALQGGGVIVVDRAGEPGRMAFLDLAVPSRSGIVVDPVPTFDGYFAQVLSSPWGEVAWEN